MKKRTITVTTGHGTITRTTARDYAFVVAARGERHDYITQHHAARSAAGPTLDELIAQADAELVAPFTCGGVWSSRLDLAQREAAKLRTFYRDVRIFEVATGREVAPVAR